METLFRFPSGKRRQILPVRRDPEFAPQLYFMTTEKCGPNLLVSFEQAIWDKTSKQISSFVFFEQMLTQEQLDTCSRIRYAIDEKSKSMHFVYEGGAKLNLGRIDLEFEKPDKLGYRRAVVPGDSYLTYQQSFFASGVDVHHGAMLRFDVIEGFDVSLTAISICPSTAELIMHCKYVDKKHHQMSFMPRSLLSFPPNLRILAVVPSRQMEARSHVLSPSNDWLTLVTYRSCSSPADTDDDKGRCMILYADDAQMQPINMLDIDPVRLVQRFLPKTLLEDLKAHAPGRLPDFMFFGSCLSLLGHVNKYVLFFFRPNYVLAAKWPTRNWYKFDHLPKMQQKRVICVDKEKKHGEIREVWMGLTDLFLKVELQGAEAVRRMSLGHKFKDYRRCAFCGKEERGKRKNKKGKRVSNFKVCRLCKELNFHKSYTLAGSGCHYCSNECVRKQWNEHKQVHSGKGKQRKL